MDCWMFFQFQTSEHKNKNSVKNHIMVCKTYALNIEVPIQNHRYIKNVHWINNKRAVITQ